MPVTVRLIAAALLAVAACRTAGAEPARLRVATFNARDIRTEELADPGNERLGRIAAMLQEIRPDILFLNEIQFDEPDGANARRFAETFLGVPRSEGAQPLRMQAFSAPSNTGQFSGFDLDHGGAADAASKGRDYGGDCWGYGEFPGQYGMALFVREGLTLDSDAVRTFQKFLWADMPDALLPVDPATGEPWYPAEAVARFPLSSKSHWDVPVRLPGGEVIHVLCSHPTPPVFDGPEDRNGRRNHDEIRFWGEYLSGAPWIVDDAGVAGGLDPDALFVVVGDLNADPVHGDSRDNPVGRWLLAHPRLAPDAPPSSEVMITRLDPTDTSRFGLRVDYVLPSVGLETEASGLVRETDDASDHFLVWVDLMIVDNH